MAAVLPTPNAPRKPKRRIYDLAENDFDDDAHLYLGAEIKKRLLMDSNHGHGATLSLNETSCLDMSGIDFMDWSSNTDDTDSHEFIQYLSGFTSEQSAGEQSTQSFLTVS